MGRHEATSPRAAVDVLLPQIFGCFFNDPTGSQSLDRDRRRQRDLSRPTTRTRDSSWPDTRQIVTKLVAGLADPVVTRILRGNAIDLLGLDLVP